MPPLTAEQLVFRKGWVGASEIASALGVSRWKKPIDIWLSKTGRAEPEPENPRAAIGHRAEPVLTQWYCEDTGTDPLLVVRGDSVRHPSVDCIGCTPDILVKADPRDHRIARAAQLKCVGAYMAQFWPDEFELPADVECQVQCELEVLGELHGITKLDVVVWLGGTDFRIVPVQRDREFGSMLLKGARDFWRWVESDNPPPIDGSESWRKYLTARYPVVEREELQPAPEYVEQWGLLALRAKDAKKQAESDYEYAANQLKSAIGDAAGVLGLNYIATWRADKNGKRSLIVKPRRNPND